MGLVEESGVPVIGLGATDGFQLSAGFGEIATLGFGFQI